MRLFFQAPRSVFRLSESLREGQFRSWVFAKSGYLFTKMSGFEVVEHSFQHYRAPDRVNIKAPQHIFPTSKFQGSYHENV